MNFFMLPTLNYPIRFFAIQYKSESRVRSVIEKLTGHSFVKVRPDFLKQPNGKNLELDGYNEELQCAFEYDGIQHRKFNPMFHKNQ